MRNYLTAFTSWVILKITPTYFALSRWKNKSFFLRNAKSHPFKCPEKGLTIIASLGGNVSLDKVMRDLAFSLRDAGIPFQTFSLSPRNKVPPQDIAPILTPLKDFRARRFSHVIEMLDSCFPAEELGLKRMTVAFWEFESGLPEHRPNLHNKQLIVGMSDFNAKYFKSAFAPKSIAKLIYPFRIETTKLDSAASTRRKYGIRDTDFMVFFNFDFDSGYHRKNPYGVLKAFAQAFGNTPNAKLVFKTVHAGAHPDKVSVLKNLVSQFGIANKCISVDNFIPQKELYELTNACDVYISLHRGEGFGLGIAEAMSLGKAVITTNYSAPTEFCNETNSIPISYRLVTPSPDQQDVPYYRNVKLWAEPDINEAAHALRHLYDNPKERLRLGDSARESISRQFAISRFKESVELALSIQ